MNDENPVNFNNWPAGSIWFVWSWGCLETPQVHVQVRDPPLLLWRPLVFVRLDFIAANLIPDPIEGLFFLEIF